MPPKKSTSSGTGKKITPVTASKTVSKTAPAKTATTTARGGSKGAAPVKQPVKISKGVAGSKTTPTNKVAAVQKKPDPNASKKGELKNKEWTKKDEMARRIQTAFRGYKCRKILLQLKQKKDDYDKLMEKLEREAYVQLVNMEREKAEKERKKEEEERRRKREEQQRKKRILEAAFDGDIEEINKILQELDIVLAKSPLPLPPVLLSKYRLGLIDCTDANGNTPLSEAAAGGQPDTIQMLFKMGANPNTKGAFGRSPLYRAAFGGHIEAVKVLLACGGDPRVRADDGAEPEQIASKPDVKEVLTSWDISETERLIKGFEDSKEKRISEERAYHKQEENKLAGEVAAAEKENSVRQKELKKAYEELNKRIYEHDKCTLKGGAKAEVTLKAIQDAEEALELCKLNADQARERLAQVKLKLRDKQLETSEGAGDEESIGVRVAVKELDDVLFRDVGNKIASDGRWPLIMDPKQQCATFLRYRDTNYMNCLDQKDMNPESLRKLLIGAIRYGKFAVLDLLDVDGWDIAVQRFDEVQKGLLESIISKKLLENERYLSLVKKEDGEEYKPERFLSGRIHNFMFIVITQLPTPPKALNDRMYCIRVVPQQSLLDF